MYAFCNVDNFINKLNFMHVCNEHVFAEVQQEYEITFIFKTKGSTKIYIDIFYRSERPYILTLLYMIFQYETSI